MYCGKCCTQRDAASVSVFEGDWRQELDIAGGEGESGEVGGGEAAGEAKAATAATAVTAVPTVMICDDCDRFETNLGWCK